MKKIVLGNDFSLIIPVSRKVHTSTGDVIQDFNLLPACTDLQVNLVNFNETISLPCNVDVEHTSRLIANVDSSKLNIGNYALEVKGKIYGNAWRSNEYEQIAFVNNNASADEVFDGEIIEGESSVEVDHVFILLPPTVELSDLINKANEALKTSKETNDTINANEEVRKEAEAQRVDAESERTNAEQSRASAEETRVSAERVINAITNGNLQLTQALKDCCCQTQQNIIKMGYENQLGQKDLINQMQQGFSYTNTGMERGLSNIGNLIQNVACDLKTNANGNTQKLIDVITANRYADLQERLEDAKRREQTVSIVAQLKSGTTTPTTGA